MFACTLQKAITMQSFLRALEIQRWDDHRYYHHSRINQSLHLLSAIHSWMVPSPFPVASPLASGLMATALTPPVLRAVSGAPVWCCVATFHSSVDPSLSAVAIVVPLALKVRAATEFPVAMARPAWFWVATFHSRTFPSSPPVARILPSGLNASVFTAAELAVTAEPASCWLATSHSWTFPSLLATASSVPSGLNATASTCLRSELIGAPISCWVATFHSRTFPSSSPTARILPSGLNFAALPPPLPASEDALG